MPGEAAPALGGGLGPWGRAALALALFPLAFALADPVWRLGLPAAWDEVALHGILQAAAEGQPLPQGAFRSPLIIRLLRAPLALGLGPAGLRALVVAAYLAECWLLWRLARRLGGPRAAAIAVAVHALGRLTWLRLGTSLGLAFFPLAGLALWTLFLEVRGALASLAVGVLAALVCLEHESLTALGPGLGWLAWRRSREGGPEALGLALGSAAGVVAMLVLLPDPAWGSWWEVRAANLRQAPLPWHREWAANLAGWVGLGDKPLQSLGPGAAFPLVALPLVLLGLVLLPGEAVLMLAAGLALLAAPAPAGIEAHRASAAWAPLCLAAGLGVAHRPPALARVALVLIAVYGVADRWALRSGAAAREHDAYEYAWRLERAAKKTRGAAVASELNFRSMGAFRLRHRGGPGLPAWALLSGEQVGPHPPPWGSWHPIQMRPGSGTLWLLRPSDPGLWAAQELWVRAQLASLEGLAWSDQLGRLEEALRAGVADPFRRSWLLDRAVLAANEVGWPPGLLAWALAQEGLSARQTLALALALERAHPGKALQLVEKALREDPTRTGARRFRAELRSRLLAEPGAGP